MSTFGERLKKLREQMGFTQQQLADAIKIGRSAIAQYETGRKMPDPEGLLKIADFFNVSVDYLLGRTNQPIYKLSKFNDLDPDTIKILNRASKLTPKAKDQLKEAVKWVFELDAREKELEKLKKNNNSG